MKKKKKMLTLVGLLVFLLALVGVLMLVKGKNQQSEEAESEEEEIESNTILSWDEEKTHKISLYTEEGEKITFTKENDEWILKGYEKISLIQDEVVSMIGYASGITAERTIEDVEDLSEFGLDEPVNVVEIETEDGEVESVAIGTQNPSTGHTYIYLNGNTDVVYTVDKNLENLYKYDLLDFVESESYPSFTSDNVRRVEVVKTGNSEESFTLLYDFSATTCWRVEDEVYGRKLADDYEGENLASMVETLSYSEFYEYDCQDFSVYGLDEPQMEIRVTYLETVEVESEDGEDETSEDEATEEDSEDGETEETVETQTVTREFVIYVGGYDDAGYYYVRLNDSSEVHGLAETHIDKLLGETAVDYWALNMSEISLSNLDYLEVEYGGETYVLKYVETEQVVENSDSSSDESEGSDSEGEVSDESNSSGSEEDVSNEESDEESVETEIITTYYVNDKEVDADAFKEFYKNAIAIECQERMTSCETETETEAELVLKFYGTDGQTVVVSYIPWDGSFYAAVNNGVDFGLVNKMNVKDLIELFLTVVA